MGAQPHFTTAIVRCGSMTGRAHSYDSPRALQSSDKTKATARTGLSRSFAIALPLINLISSQVVASNMAILDAAPGLSTEITVNRVPLAEYDDPEAEKSPFSITKYVEAVSGSEFVIKTSFQEPILAINGVEISVRIDGNRGPRRSIKPGFYQAPNEIAGVWFSQDGKRYHQNYQFAELDIGNVCSDAGRVRILIFV